MLNDTLKGDPFLLLAVAGETSALILGIGVIAKPGLTALIDLLLLFLGVLLGVVSTLDIRLVFLDKLALLAGICAEGRSEGGRGPGATGITNWFSWSR